MIGIIIPVKNGGENIKHALKSLVSSTNYPNTIIVIDGGSTDGTKEVLETWEKQFEHIKTFNIKSKGLIDTINYGINKAKELGCEGVYLTQDDVIHFRLFNKDWLQIMAEISNFKNCGQVISIGAGGVSGPSYIDGLHWAGTWSTYIPMRVINEVGLFDENFNPGCGDDIDYSYRVQKAGLLIYIANFWVDHHRQGKHLNEDKKIMEAHSKYFRIKWKL